MVSDVLASHPLPSGVSGGSLPRSTTRKKNPSSVSVVVPPQQLPVPEACEIRRGEKVALPNGSTIDFKGNIASRTCFSVDGEQVKHFNNRFPMTKASLWCYITPVGNSVIHVTLRFERMTEDAEVVADNWQAGVEAAARCGMKAPCLTYNPGKLPTKKINRRRGQ